MINRECINLIYFGRITESKNIELIIKVLSVLIDNGYKATLGLIGGCSETYRQRLLACKREMHLPSGSVIFHGKKTFDFIASKLGSAHYFVFPSEEKKEGHSNSLTEAMAFGVVPIVSSAGFNQSICGDDRLVVSEFSEMGFANKIMEIESSGKWDYFSHFVYNRVIANFTEKQALESLKQVINALYSE